MERKTRKAKGSKKAGARKVKVSTTKRTPTYTKPILIKQRDLNQLLKVLFELPDITDDIVEHANKMVKELNYIEDRLTNVTYKFEEIISRITDEEGKRREDINNVLYKEYIEYGTGME